MVACCLEWGRKPGDHLELTLTCSLVFSLSFPPVSEMSEPVVWRGFCFGRGFFPCRFWLQFPKFTDILKWNEVKWSRSVMSDSATPWTVAYQAPPSMGFSKPECWSGLPFPSPGDFPDPGIKPGSPALRADSLPWEPSGKQKVKCYNISLIGAIQQGMHSKRGLDNLQWWRNLDHF